MLSRERLLERMRRRWVVPVTVLVAPAGYGKTTLLSQAVTVNAAAPMGIDCWLTCDPELTTASSLAQALGQAVDVPQINGRDPREQVRTIVEALWRRSPRQVTVVLDDVHEIPPGSDAAGLLAQIVADLPANGHLVLAGRREPPVPLARLEVQGRMVRVDETDLAFTDTELAAFAELRQVPPERVAGSGGWPALAELSASTRLGASSDYVGQEVMPEIPDDRRRALALLADVGSFDDELAAAVLGTAASAASLVADLPLVSHGAHGEHALHSLWRSLLAADASPDEHADARRRAGLALLGRGRVDRAMRLLIEAEAWDAIGEAIVTALGTAHRPVARDLLEEWFKLLPESVRATPPGRLLAAVIAVEGDLGGAWHDFEECAAAFRTVGETTGELACLVQMGQLAWWSGNTERLAPVAGRTFELEAAGREEAVPFACLGRALLHDIMGDSHRVLVELDRIPPGSLNETWTALLSWARASAQLQLGYLTAAESSAEQALAGPTAVYAPVAGAPNLTRLQAIWFQGRLAEVVDQLPPLLDGMADSGYPNSTALIAAQCSVMWAYRADPVRAARCLDQARATAALVPDAPVVATNLALAQGAHALASGDESAAAEVLADYVARYPIGVGLPVAAQRRHLALLYVLVPSSRSTWDGGEDLGPAWTVGLDLAHALVAVRERGRLPADTPPLDDHEIVEAHLPPAWAAELGVAAVAEGRDDGWQLLEATWPRTRPAVAQLATRCSGGMRRAAREILAELPAPPTSQLELRLLGPIELWADGAPVRSRAWRRERVRFLLAYLALHGTISRSQVADDLWPSLDAEAQSRNLRVTLTYLLHVLEPQRVARDASFFIRQDGANLILHREGWLTGDLWDFDALCDQAEEADERGAPATALDRALRAVELWRGEPTDLLSEHWAVGPLERRRTRFAAIATRAGELLLAQRRFERARVSAEQALAVEPWHEPAHRLLIAAHQAAGNVIAARAALERYRVAAHDLGVDLDETTLMVERLLTDLPE